jgi:hypothetical protein
MSLRALGAGGNLTAFPPSPSPTRQSRYGDGALEERRRREREKT